RTAVRSRAFAARRRQRGARSARPGTRGESGVADGQGSLFRGMARRCPEPLLRTRLRPVRTKRSSVDPRTGVRRRAGLVAGLVCLAVALVLPSFGAGAGVASAAAAVGGQLSGRVIDPGGLPLPAADV